VDPYVLVSEPTSTPSLWKFRLHVLAADSGAELYSVTNVDEIGYTGFAAGTSRVAGLREGVNSTNIHWSLDWWNVSGAFEGGLLFPQPPAGTTLLMGEVAVGPTDRIAVGLGFQAPAGVTLDIDPGPGVQMFVTPNDGVQLAIVEVAP
jgi:hypothetical protein